MPDLNVLGRLGVAGLAAPPRSRQEGYQFAADNPYAADPDSYAKVGRCALTHNPISLPSRCTYKLCPSTFSIVTT